MPVPSISVREKPEGGPVSPEASPKFGFELVSSRLIILIHGYNNHEDEALESYGEFLEHSGLDKATLAGQACGFLWPGDQWGPLAALSYPVELKPAKESADALHRFLMRQTAPGGWPLEVTLVCHSLGNRVGLELVRDHIEAGRPGKLGYRAGCFMAAAVPVFMVEDGGKLRPAAVEVNRTLALYSADDIVLHWAFPVGETVAGEGLLPVAVGRFGQPAAGAWSQRADMAPYNHWHYWGHPESAEEVAAFLGLAVENALPESVIPARATAEAPEPPSREIAGRALPVRALA